MDIVGLERARSDDDVHTVDVWFSRRRGCWMVERVNASGHLVGAAHCCASEAEAEACLDEWLRAHGETHLTTPRKTTPHKGTESGCGSTTAPDNKVVALASRARAA